MNEEEYMQSLPVSQGTAIDIGACYGAYTRILAEKFKKVYAIEPHPENFRRLKGILDVYPNVEIVQKAFGVSYENTKLYENGHPSGNTLDFRWMGGWDYSPQRWIEVPSITIDDFCRDKRIEFIKCDVEGAEDTIWKYACDTLYNHTNLTILLETHQTTDLIELYNDFNWWDYSFFELDNTPADVLKSNQQYLIKR